MHSRAATRFSNPGGLAVMWCASSASLVVIGLTELPNSRWAKAHPSHPLAASLTHQKIARYYPVHIFGLFHSVDGFYHLSRTKYHLFGISIDP